MIFSVIVLRNSLFFSQGRLTKCPFFCGFLFSQSTGEIHIFFSNRLMKFKIFYFPAIISWHSQFFFMTDKICIFSHDRLAKFAIFFNDRSAKFAMCFCNYLPKFAMCFCDYLTKFALCIHNLLMKLEIFFLDCLPKLPLFFLQSIDKICDFFLQPFVKVRNILQH